MNIGEQKTATTRITITNKTTQNYTLVCRLSFLSLSGVVGIGSGGKKANDGVDAPDLDTIESLSAECICF